MNDEFQRKMIAFKIARFIETKFKTKLGEEFPDSKAPSNGDAKAGGNANAPSNGNASAPQK